MGYLIFFIVIVGIIWVANEYLGVGGGKKEEVKYPYRKKDYLLSVAENKFYQALKVVADQHDSLLFAKVRLEDLLWLPKGIEDRFSLRNRIKSRHIDFLLCNKTNVQPILAIELDDSSHGSADRIKRDDFIDKVFKDASFPLLHVRNQASYDLNELTNKIKDKLPGNNKE